MKHKDLKIKEFSIGYTRADLKKVKNNIKYNGDRIQNILYRKYDSNFNNWNFILLDKVKVSDNEKYKDILNDVKYFYENVVQDLTQEIDKYI